MIFTAKTVSKYINEKIINKSFIQKAVPLFVYSETVTAHENTAAAKKKRKSRPKKSRSFSNKNKRKRCIKYCNNCKCRHQNPFLFHHILNLFLFCKTLLPYNYITRVLIFQCSFTKRELCFGKLMLAFNIWI